MPRSAAATSTGRATGPTTLGELLDRGRAQGHLSLSELRDAFTGPASIPPRVAPYYANSPRRASASPPRPRTPARRRQR